MNIVFMGSPDFAVPGLEAIHGSEHTISAVVTNVDKRRGRGSDKSPTEVKAKASELGLKIIEVEDLKEPGFEAQLKELDADLFVVVAFRILPKNILDIPKIGSINLHASLLPKYRGAAPIHWAVINGEDKTGCTVFFLDEQVDTGNILLQKSMDIGDEETTGEVYKRLMEQGSQALTEALDMISKGNYELENQDDSKATPAPKLFKENTRLDFSLPAKNVHNKIRGLSPFPVAWTEWKGEKVKIFKSRLGPMANVEPGDFFQRDDMLLIGCGDNTIEILELQLPGRKRMTAEEFMNGFSAEGVMG